MCDFDLDAIIFGTPEHSQPLAEFFESFDPTSLQEKLHVENETQVVDTCSSVFCHSTPQPVEQVGEYELLFPPNPLPWASLIDTCSLFSHSTPQPVTQVGDFQLAFPPTPLPWASEPLTPVPAASADLAPVPSASADLAPMPAASADPVPSNSALATPVSEPRLASACREERVSKRQRNNIAVKKCRC